MQDAIKNVPLHLVMTVVLAEAWAVVVVYILWTIMALVLHFHPTLSRTSLLLHGKLLESDGKVKASFYEKMLVPKRCFCCFYLVGWVVNLFVILHGHRSLVFILMQAHHSRRIIECLFVHSYSDDSFMHVGHFVCGMLYYVLLELSLIMAVVDGESHGYDETAVIGICLFIFASAIQMMAHLELGRMKREDESVKRCSQEEESSLLFQRAKNKRSDKRKFPENRLFSLVYCPHYFAEILIYLSVCIIGMRGFSLEYYHLSLPMWANLLWVVANLSITGIRNKNWYERRFPRKSSQYPCRKAIIPFVL